MKIEQREKVFVAIIVILYQITYIYLSIIDSYKDNFIHRLNLVVYFFSFILLFNMVKNTFSDNKKRGIASAIIIIFFLIQTTTYKMFESRMILQGEVLNKKIVNKEYYIDILPSNEEETIRIKCNKFVYSLIVKGDLYSGIYYKVIPFSDKFFLTDLNHIDIID